MNKSKRGGIGAVGSRLLSLLSEAREEVFTVEDAEKVSGFKGAKLRKLLHDLAKNRWVERIERGKYIVLPLEAGPKAEYGTHPYIIARKLASPYYVGFTSALNYYGITEQISKTAYVATVKPKKPLEFHSEKYYFVCLDKKRFFGTREEWIGNLKFNISNVEKTIIDCLYLLEYSGGLVEVIKAFKMELNYSLLLEYAVKMDDLALVKRLGYLLDVLKVKSSITDKLLKRVSGGFCLLDPSGPRNGVKNMKWRVIENIRVEDLTVEL
ncbi:MAG: type IV toxin-antitoxin system AbiEi family antitoxin [Candidatus Micrarchaeota archaeon]